VVSPWKVILATLVIFVTGLFTGAIGVTRLFKTSRPAPRVEAMQPWMLRENFRAELDRRLDLTAEQSVRIERAMYDGQERIKEIWSLIGPEIQTELRAVREEIRRELNPEQRRQFEQLIRERRPRRLEMEPPNVGPHPGPQHRPPPPGNTYPPSHNRD
jgi:hypothetical protein